MIVRPLAATDAAQLRPFRLAALQESPASFGASYEEAISHSLEDFEKRLERPKADGRMFGAFSKDKLIGSAGLSRHEGIKERHKIWIWGMYVIPDHRRQGVARALMKALIEEIQTLDDILLIKLTVGAGNSAAKSLYKDFGFTVFGTEPSALNVAGHLHDEDYMYRYLNAA